MAVFTLNTPAGQDARILASYGRRFALGRDATGAEVKARLIALLIQDVLEEEQAAQSAAARATVTPVTPT